MKKIEVTKLIEATNAKEYHENLDAIIKELQASELDVEVNHSMSRAQKGIGYMYSAIVIGRK